LVSAVNPKLYAERFLNFLEKEVIVNEDKQHIREAKIDEIDKEEAISSLFASL
jgi:hypothetical protein